MGLGVGNVRTAVDSCGSDAGRPASPCSVSGADVGGKVFAGYQFNRYVAVEGGIASLGGITERWTSSGSEFRTISPFLRAFAYGVGTWPIAEDFGLFGRLGVGWTADVGVAGGLGLKYEFNENVGIRFEAERFYVSNLFSSPIRFHITLLSASVVFFLQKN